VSFDQLIGTVDNRHMWADNETRIDLLGFEFLVDELLLILRDPSLLPVTVGVAGDWGSGKSSLIGMAEEAVGFGNSVRLCRSVSSGGRKFDSLVNGRSIAFADERGLGKFDVAR
jgi:hypothetical protein